MKIHLKKYTSTIHGHINLVASKSESNRALVINALAGGRTENLSNLAKARDTQTMISLLTEQPDVYDVKDAGTTMRFLTAYLAVAGGDFTITGTDRMKERPIGPLVACLRSLGAEISYLEKEGYPPLRIQKITHQTANRIEIPGNISSQYISALLMIAPVMEQGLEIVLTTEVYSRPYIEMTLALMRQFGVSATWSEEKIHIAPQPYQPTSYTVEGDWSGASYWFSMVSLAAKDAELYLPTLRKHSTQGDQAIVKIMAQLGVETRYEEGGIQLKKKTIEEKELSIDFRDCPDLAQTVFVVAAVKGVKLHMTGLESLKIKETDRIAAMQTELSKIGATLIEENNHQWTLTPNEELPASVEIATYEDHRMAMAFAPLCTQMEVTIDDPEVVAKSYPTFWEDIRSLNITASED